MQHKPDSEHRPSLLSMPGLWWCEVCQLCAMLTKWILNNMESSKQRSVYRKAGTICHLAFFHFCRTANFICLQGSVAYSFSITVHQTTVLLLAGLWKCVYDCVCAVDTREASAGPLLTSIFQLLNLHLQLLGVVAIYYQLTSYHKVKVATLIS